MSSEEKPLDRIVYELRERAKELNCLYRVQEVLNTPGVSIDQACEGIIQAIPPGWQYPDVCEAQIVLNGRTYQTKAFTTTPWCLQQEIIVQDQVVGKLSVCYNEERAEENEGPFLKEERKLINTISEQLGMFLLHEELKHVFEVQQLAPERKEDWRVIIELLQRTDPSLMVRISRKMVNTLIWSGVSEANDLLHFFSPAYRNSIELTDVNLPTKFEVGTSQLTFIDTIFELASNHMSEETVLQKIQSWIKEDQSDFLAHVLVHPGSSLDEIDSAIERYHHLAAGGLELSEPRDKSARSSLARRLLTNDPSFIDKAKDFIPIDQYYAMFKKMIYSSGSHGTVGGKSAGLILAHQILKHAFKTNSKIGQIKIPKTWYITSDSLFNFLSHNGIEEVIEQKYKPLEQVRHEYPYIIHIFKNSSLPPDILRNLQIALDDFDTSPLIVRSSSLLEDRTGMAFAGKYKSLFIPNQGTREERLAALIDAITEVYASMFGPDPIEYRIEHNLIDQHEEMGILIQEVVGTKVGPYYLPAFAGVAFSSNQFPWSNRLKQEDGLVRLVPGLGTRAVDRLSNDYPVMVSPGQPGLRIHASPEEIIRYSPKKADVIDLQAGTFNTVGLMDIINPYGSEYPDISSVVSLVSDGYIQHPASNKIDFKSEEMVITFENLFSRTPFLAQIDAILSELENTLGYPVDIEFAHDGSDFYLLQCRSQNFPVSIQPAELPENIETDRVIFSSNQYVTNTLIKDISHIVFINPVEYDKLKNRSEFLEVGRIVGKLNNLLPRKKFILIGPGRWGSRGEFRLGVHVSFADIRNSAMLVEIATHSTNAKYEPSFGTHFFQDLVEASIRFIALDPDNPDMVFNWELMRTAENLLPKLLPGDAHLSKAVKVIDIKQSTNWQALQIHMNADEQKAIAFMNG